MVLISLEVIAMKSLRWNSVINGYLLRLLIRYSGRENAVSFEHTVFLWERSFLSKEVCLAVGSHRAALFP